jgi:hypothetical protein
VTGAATVKRDPWQRSRFRLGVVSVVLGDDLTVGHRNYLPHAFGAGEQKLNPVRLDRQRGGRYKTMLRVNRDSPGLTKDSPTVRVKAQQVYWKVGHLRAGKSLAGTIV